MTEPVRADKAHIQIGNRLFEAILDSTMKPRQKCICFALLRVTVGWHQVSVTITQDELADAAGDNPGGTFRALLKGLETEGVVVVESGKDSGHANEYRLNPDFTHWGRYSVAPERLRKVYGKRHPGQTKVAQPQADGSPPVGDGSPTTRREGRPAPGEGTGSKPLPDFALDLRKDMKYSTTTTITPSNREKEGSLTPPMSGQPSGLHARRVAHTDLEAEWQRERREAARLWADDPDNAFTLSDIDSRARDSIGPLNIDQFVGKNAYEGERTRLIAELIRFPTFTAWKSAKTAD